MNIRLLASIIVICSACHQGLLPCPEAKAPKLKESKVGRYMRFPERSLTGSASADENKNEQVYKLPKNEPALKHVSVEEWDCPRPGDKRNMPKAVKQNIRKNLKRVKSYYRDMPDSTEVFTTQKLVKNK